MRFSITGLITPGGMISESGQKIMDEFSRHGIDYLPVAGGLGLEIEYNDEDRIAKIRNIVENNGGIFSPGLTYQERKANYDDAHPLIPAKKDRFSTFQVFLAIPVLVFLMISLDAIFTKEMCPESKVVIVVVVGFVCLLVAFLGKQRIGMRNQPAKISTENP